jgi:glycosyltransferase involved in cell wall biosynthesis
MRILIGMPDPGTRSGPTACEPPFVAALRALGVEIVETTFVYGDNLEPTPAAARVARVTRTAWQLRRIARAQRFDLVHLNSSFDAKTVFRDSFTLSLLGRSTAPVFLKLHGSDPTLLTAARPPIRTLARFVLRRVSAIGVLSSAERAQLVAEGVPARKVGLVRNALPSLLHATQSREAFLAGHGLPAEASLLLFISRLIRTKGVLDAIHACVPLRDRGRRVVLCCVGDGPVRAEAESEAARLGLGDSVRFFGFVPESQAADFYRHCEVLVFPTFHDEGLPVVLLNALAAGLPIVTTRTRGAIDYLAEPDTCLWAEPHRPEQVADRVEMLLGDPAKRVAMGARARELARSFEPAKVAREYLELYERLVGSEPVSEPVDSVAVGRAESDLDVPL